jgi:hypothetical protein
MMNEKTIGLDMDAIMQLSPQARELYNAIFDYCTYASDPQYQTLHKFRNQIDRMAIAADRDALIAYFNQDPAIRFNGMHCEPFEYYKEPY